MIEPLLALPPHARSRLATALASGTLPLVCTAAALRSALGVSEGIDPAVDALAGLARAGVPAEAAVHVGDSLDLDARAASAAGLAAILLDRGGCYPANSWRPTISSLEALPSSLAGLS